MGVPVQKFLKARRDRALGSILGHVEREIWPLLSPEQRTTLRSVTIDALNGYHDSVLDLVKSEDDIRNDELVAVLERVQRELANRERLAPARI